MRRKSESLSTKRRNANYAPPVLGNGSMVVQDRQD